LVLIVVSHIAATFSHTPFLDIRQLEPGRKNMSGRPESPLDAEGKGMWSPQKIKPGMESPCRTWMILKKSHWSLSAGFFVPAAS